MLPHGWASSNTTLTVSPDSSGQRRYNLWSLYDTGFGGASKTLVAHKNLSRRSNSPIQFYKRVSSSDCNMAWSCPCPTRTVICQVFCGNTNQLFGAICHHHQYQCRHAVRWCKYIKPSCVPIFIPSSV